MKKKRRPFFDIRAWIGVDIIKHQSNYIRFLAKRLFIPAQPTIKENFDTAVERLQLSEEILKEREVTFYKTAKCFFILTSLLFVYSLYTLFQATYWIFFASFALSCILLAQSFRYHFWYFQIKQRKLGCNMKAWFIWCLRGTKQ